MQSAHEAIRAVESDVGHVVTAVEAAHGVPFEQVHWKHVLVKAAEVIRSVHPDLMRTNRDAHKYVCYDFGHRLILEHIARRMVAEKLLPAEHRDLFVTAFGRLHDRPAKEQFGEQIGAIETLEHTLGPQKVNALFERTAELWGKRPFEYQPNAAYVQFLAGELRKLSLSQQARVLIRQYKTYSADELEAMRDKKPGEYNSLLHATAHQLWVDPNTTRDEPVKKLANELRESFRDVHGYLSDAFDNVAFHLYPQWEDLQYNRDIATSKFRPQPKPPLLVSLKEHIRRIGERS